MTALDWNLENLYKCPGFFGEISEENAKQILREAFQNGKTRCEGILFLKVRKFLNQIVLFAFPPKGTNDFFIDSGKKFVGFYEEMRTNKFASEISWPLKTVTDDTGKAHFTIVLGCLQNRNPNHFYFTESHLQIADEIFRPNFAALRKNPISLEEMAKVKIATSGVNLESLYLPPRIKTELKKYQDLNKTFFGLVVWQYCLTHYGTPGQLWGIFKIE